MKKPKRWAPSLLAIVVTGCGHGLPARQLSPVEDGYRESPVQIAARLRSKSPQERVTATEMLRIGAKEDRIPTFVDLLATDPDKAVVQEAASGLAQMRSERVARALWNVRGNIRGSRLRALAYALRGKDDALAFSMLKTMSRDPIPASERGASGAWGLSRHTAHRPGGI